MLGSGGRSATPRTRARAELWPLALRDNVYPRSPPPPARERDRSIEIANLWFCARRYYATRVRRAIPRRSDSVKLGGRRPRAGGRREGVGEPRWFGRPRGWPFHTFTSFHTPRRHPRRARAGARARKPEHSGGITGAGPGWSGAPWVSRPRSSSPGASITVIPGRWNVPPRARATHISHTSERGRRAALSLYACKLLAPPTHTTENTLTVGPPTRATQTPCP